MWLSVYWQKYVSIKLSLYKHLKINNFYILKTFMLKYYSSYLQARHSDIVTIFCLVFHFILSDILSKIACYPLNWIHKPLMDGTCNLKNRNIDYKIHFPCQVKNCSLLLNWSCWSFLFAIPHNLITISFPRYTSQAEKISTFRTKE